MLAEFAVGQVLWSMIWFFIFVLWIMLLFHVFGDIFRSPDLSGVAKTLWTIFVIFLPFLGVFVYLIARGDNMAKNSLDAAQAQQEQMSQYIRETAGTAATPAQELERLAALKEQGVIDDAEFARLKAQALA
jgi:hypothetical protein